MLIELEVARLIIVGDPNQLPSIESGSLLKDLIDSERITSVVLKKIHRQGNGSEIATRSHEIIDGSACKWNALSNEAFSLSLCSYPMEESIQIVDRLVKNGEKFLDFLEHVK